MADLSENFLNWYESATPGAREKFMARRSPMERVSIEEAHTNWQKRPGVAETIGIHGLEGATLGFGGEVTGFGHAVGEKVADWMYGDDLEKARHLSLQSPEPEAEQQPSFAENYTAGRNKFDKRADEARAAHPGVAIASNIAGGMFPGTLTPGVTGGLVGGAIAGAGNSDADLVNGDAGDWANFAGDTAKGAGIGAGVAFAAPYAINAAVGGAKKLGGAVKSLTNGLGNKVDDMANQQAFQATYPALKDFNMIDDAERAARGGHLLDKGAIKFGDSAKNVAERLGPLRQQAGAEIGAALKAADSTGKKVNVNEMADYLESEVLSRFKAPADRDLAAVVQEEIDAIREFGKTTPELSFSDAEEILKRKMQGKANFDQATPARLSSARQQLAGATNEKIERDVLDKAPDAYKPFTAAKDSYSKIAPSEDIAVKAANRIEKNQAFGLHDRLMAVAGTVATKGNVSGGVFATIANKLVRERGASSAAVTLKVLAKALKSKGPAAEVAEALANNPSSLGKYGTALLNAAARSEAEFLKMAQAMAESNPKYRKKLTASKQGEK